MMNEQDNRGYLCDYCCAHVATVDPEHDRLHRNLEDAEAAGHRILRARERSELKMRGQQLLDQGATLDERIDGAEMIRRGHHERDLYRQAQRGERFVPNFDEYVLHGEYIFEPRVEAELRARAMTRILARSDAP